LPCVQEGLIFIPSTANKTKQTTVAGLSRPAFSPRRVERGRSEQNHLNNLQGPLKNENFCPQFKNYSEFQDGNGALNQAMAILSLDPSVTAQVRYLQSWP
jgi:hypothetical protein